MEGTAEDDRYTLSEILQLMSATSHLPATHQPATPPSLLLRHDVLGDHHRNLTLMSDHDEHPQPAPVTVPHQYYYDVKTTSTMSTTTMMMMMMGGDQDQQLPRHGGKVNDSGAAGGGDFSKYTSSGVVLCGSEMMEMEMSNCMGGGNMRWPRQETLALLEIRSQLDSKFKDANQKAPLWDDVSRIMAEEHGYHRSGKKCKEKFENLYKYYKKTKAGKVGKPDGKHYRFFRQLEALYGETNKNNTTVLPNQLQNDKLSDQMLSISIPSELETSSSESHQNDLATTNSLMGTNTIAAQKSKKESDDDGCWREKQKWKLKASEFITTEMGKMIEMQEAWFEKMFKTLEDKEQEMQMRREKWRKQELTRRTNECKFWANEHAWIKTRYVLLTEVLQKLMESRGEGVETEWKKKHKENSGTCYHVQTFDSRLNRREHKTIGNNPATNDATFGF